MMEAADMQRAKGQGFRPAPTDGEALLEKRVALLRAAIFDHVHQAEMEGRTASTLQSALVKDEALQPVLVVGFNLCAS